MPRITRAEIAAAQKNLADIHELATESGNWDAASARYHAPMATRALDTLAKTGHSPPDRALRNRRFLEAQGWRFPYGKCL